MRNIKLTIEYNGTQFSGWQIQSPGQRTVQGEMESALKIIFNEDIRINGSGRTDAGVHALAQIANFKTASLMKSKDIVRALNGNLPRDISVLKAEDVKEQFHAQFSARRKTYRYTVFSRSSRPTIDNDFVFHMPYKIDLKALRREAMTLLGKHDFRSFTATDENNLSKDTVRHIYKISIQRKRNTLIFEITANGFLYKMVRNIIGTLLDVATGLIPSGSIKKILNAKSRASARNTAPAKGLCLIKVEY